MKLFTIVAGCSVRVHDGMRVHEKPFPHVNLIAGQSRLPVQEQFAKELIATGGGIVHRATLLRDPAQDRRMLVPETDGSDQRALVRLITSWPAKAPSMGVPRKVRCPNRSEKMAGRCKLCGTQAEERRTGFWGFNWSAGWYHPDTGEIDYWNKLPVMEEAKSGGPLEQNLEALAELNPGDSMRILINIAWPLPVRERFMLWDGTTLHTGSRDEIFSPSRLDTKDWKTL